MMTPVGPGDDDRSMEATTMEATTMLTRTDPFRELDRLTQQVFGRVGTWSRPSPMPLEAYRDGDVFVVQFDLPGVDPESIDLHVEQNTLTVKAERRPTLAGEGVETVVAQRPYGVFSRRLVLGDALDADHIEAHYDAGVLTVRIPVTEEAKPRRIQVKAGSTAQLTG